MLPRLLRISKTAQVLKALAEQAERLAACEDTTNLAYCQLNQTERPIRVVFLAYDAPTWNATVPLVRHLLKDIRFTPTVLSLPHSYGSQGVHGAAFHGEAAMHSLLEEQQIPHMRIREPQLGSALHTIKRLRPHYIFRQRPWPLDLPPDLGPRALTFARLCYLPYSYLASGLTDSQFNGEYHQLCDLMFWPDSFHQELALKHHAGRLSRCVMTGYPKFDHLLACTDHFWPVGHSPTDHGTFRLIWAPHWTVENRNVRDGMGLRYGTFDALKQEMVRLAIRHPHIQITMRPHPILLEHLEHAATGSQYERFLRTWHNLPNVAISREPDYAPLFHASDALLTDGVSFVTEYQLLDKPVIFLRRANSMPLNPAGVFTAQGAHQLTSITSVEELILNLMNGREDQHVSARRRFVTQSIHPWPGQAARHIADELVRHLESHC